LGIKGDQPGGQENELISLFLLSSYNIRKDFYEKLSAFAKMVDFLYSSYELFEEIGFEQAVKQYDMWLLQELLNNCIAHIDYTIWGRVYLNEFVDKIMFANPGTFLPGGIEPVLNPTYNPPYKRNRLLADSMMNFNMIDTQACQQGFTTSLSSIWMTG